MLKEVFKYKAHMQGNNLGLYKEMKSAQNGKN